MEHRSWLAARFAFLLAATAGPLAAVAGPAAQESAEGFQRPSFALLRQDEDWSGLADAGSTKDPLDPIKYVPLNEDGSIWIGFGGHARARVEGWSGFGFGAPAGATTDDLFGLTRLALHADLHFGERVRVFVEGKSALAFERELPGGIRAIDEDELALQQAFADFAFDIGEGSRLTLRPGRQMLAFGRQRLVSPLPWANALRTWDGVSAVLESGGWKATAFATHFVPVDRTAFNDSDHGHDFGGLYVTGTAGPVSLDLYWMRRDRDTVAFNGTAGDEERDTFGTRVWGDAADGRLDWELETAVQTGEVGAQDISGAWMLATQAGWRLRDAAWKPRLWLGFDYASGDDEAGGDVGTFDQLFPLGHAYLGQADVVGRQNIVDASAGASFAVADGVSLDVAQHTLWLADTDDALYTPGGGVARPGGSFRSSFVGVEVDVRLGWRIDRHWKAGAGYSHVFAGRAIEQSGPDDDLDFAYLSLTYTF